MLPISTHPDQRAPLIGLVALWLLAYISCLVSAFRPFWLAAIDLAFPFVLYAVAAQEILGARD